MKSYHLETECKKKKKKKKRSTLGQKTDGVDKNIYKFSVF